MRAAASESTAVSDAFFRLRRAEDQETLANWKWFRDEWDDAMVRDHGSKWAEVFAGWIQTVLDDERSNAFSTFVFNETCRVFHGVVALQVPGS